MAIGNRNAPSPVRAGLFHSFVSLVSVSAILGLVGIGVHLTGNPSEAGPRQVVALFETGGETSREAHTQLIGTQRPAGETLGRGTRELEIEGLGTSGETRSARLASVRLADGELVPNLGVDDPAGVSDRPERAQRVQVADQRASAPAGPQGMTINGVFVPVGKSYRQVEEGSGPDPVSRIQPVSEIAQGSSPAQDEAEAVTVRAATAAPITISTPADRNERAFDNPADLPIVSLIVGGLGTSARQTRAAIDDLPPEITLSFVADASPSLIRRARDKGHEVLLEVPMEAYEPGRTLPHSQTLRTDASGKVNAGRLDTLLNHSNDFFGVINHHGEKIADTDGALEPVFKRLEARGLAFFRHGSTPSRGFDTAAAKVELTYAAAARNIDHQVEAEAIEGHLYALERQALSKGAALGTGFAYPLTIDIITAWTRKLKAKGILLAPASAIPAALEDSGQTLQVEVSGTRGPAR